MCKENDVLFVELAGMHDSIVVLARSEIHVRRVVVHCTKVCTIVLGVEEDVLVSVDGAICLVEVGRTGRYGVLTSPELGPLHLDDQYICGLLLLLGLLLVHWQLQD